MSGSDPMKILDAPENVTRLEAWLHAINEVGCFKVSGEKRYHVIPKPDCPACMATYALRGETVPRARRSEADHAP